MPEVRSKWKCLPRSFRSELRWHCRLWKRGVFPAWIVVGLLLSAILAWQVDKAWMDHVLGAMHRGTRQQAGGIVNICSFFNQAGDFYFTLAIVLVLLVVQRYRRSPFLKRLIISVIFSACLVTVAGRITKVALGRVRPREMLRLGAETWCSKGPNFDSNYNSFPSGHASLASAGSGPLLVAAPTVGAPLALISFIIGGSRAVGLYHYPSDVFGGTWLGMLIGCSSGWRLRRIMKRAKTIRAAGGRPNSQCKIMRSPPE